MTQQFMVQVGAMGAIGRFQAVDWSPYQRGEQVICRTVRGLEVGRLLSEAPTATAEFDGDLIRKTSIEDRLLISRLELHRNEAFAACQDLLGENNLDAILVDVEHLFDGQSVFFYFLGEVDAETQEITSRLAAQYEKSVKFRKFSETLHEGCGPDCGTDKAEGCGSGGCSNCAVSASCGVKTQQAPSG